MKLTPWFPGSIKPVHEGVYRVKIAGLTVLYYSKFWHGRWHASSAWAHFAINEQLTRHKSWAPITHWRGLAEKPNP